MAELNIERPNDKLTITFRGEERELFMSFFRLNSCLRVVGDSDRLATMLIDPDIAEDLVRVMVAEKAGPGAMYEVELGEDDVSFEDIEKILVWVRDHLTHFFVKRLQQIGEQGAELEPLARQLVQSLPGLVRSNSNGASAGPSTAVPATSTPSTGGEATTT